MRSVWNRAHGLVRQRRGEGCQEREQLSQRLRLSNQAAEGDRFVARFCNGSVGNCSGCGDGHSCCGRCNTCSTVSHRHHLLKLRP